MAAQTQPDVIEQGDVTALLRYTVDTGIKPVNETYGPAGLMRRQVGTMEDRAVVIHNGRPYARELKLDARGFEFVHAPTKMRNYFDEAELKSVGYAETEALIKKASGAKRVHIFDHTLRSGDEAERMERKIREPVRAVHNDYTEWSGPQRIRDIFPDKADEILKHRFAIIQVWRPINKPVEADPFALADARSLDEKDFIAAERRHPDRVGEIYQFKFNKSHRWYYFPRMTRNEAIVFKVYDSAKDGRARWTGHTSFEDPTTPPGAAPRESIELRAFAFFD
ncbi:MAG: CmcJ/NvfI family oxidoreductase [Alphaproteobacteria bacterium]